MLLLFEMDNYEEGDLTDIVRGGRSRSRSSTSNCKTELGDQEEEDNNYYYNPHDQWSSCSQFSSQLLLQDHHQYNFGDPFCSSAAASASSLDLHQHQLDNTNNVNNAFFNGGITTSSATTQEDHELIIKSPSNNSNIFSRMLQISPSPNKFSTISSSSLNSSSNNFLIPNHSPPHPDHNLHHFLHHNHDNNPSASAALHISSPRNPPGIKRRKSQARKVVCVPAPVAASSRPNGEVIPSDLWAWRKYGQKPIKGSPYPRGYYRCSSSKGCSARKQVERSRTDPNMLVITYTSEHNHPWPTQRNALAGSSRSQQSKNNNNNNIITTTTTTSTTTPNSSKLSQDQDQDQDQNKATSATTTSNNNNNNNVKEEEMIENHSDQGFDEDHDFFADLEELQTDPLTLLFTTTTTQQQQPPPHKLDQIKGSAATTTTTTTAPCLHDVVPFSNLFDWSPPSDLNNNNSTLFHEQPPPPPPPPTTPTNRGFY